MEINNIKFVQGEEGAVPDVITASITLKEAVWIGNKAGNETKNNPPSHEIYNALVGDLFNRYWDDGIDGALKTIKAKEE